MNMISKRALALAGAAALTLTALTGCGSAQESAAASVDAATANFPLTETVTFTALTHEPSFAGQEINDRLIAQRLEEATNVHIDWTVYVDDQFGEKKQLALAKKELPDIVFDAQMSQYDLLRYAKDGTIVAVDELIDQYMPNLKKILDDNPQYRQEITAPNGHTYGFPYIEEMKGLVLTPGPLIINKTWLDELGLEVPTTVDEWVECLKAFRDGGDLNGNGEDDEIPMATWFGADDTFGSYNMFYRFTGAFGCADSYCGGNEYADHLRLIDGQVTFTALDEAFRKTAEFFNMLYEEGLIWNGSFEADSSAAYTASLIKEDVARIGCMGVWTDQEITNLDVHDQYVAVPRLQGEAGMTGSANNYSELQDSSNTAITTTCKFPHFVALFVDYMVGDPEIAVQSNWGAEGYNYVRDEEGILATPLDENGYYAGGTEEWNTFGLARANTTPARGSMIVLDEYYDTVCRYTYDAVTLLEWQKVNGKDDILAEYDTIPRVLMETDELTRLAQIQPTISDTVDRYIVDWVTNGVTDESWASYQSELEAAGVNDLVEIYQTAVDRAAENEAGSASSESAASKSSAS